MTWLSLSKYLIVVLIASFLVYKIHDSGRQAERTHCLNEWNEFIAQSEQSRRNAEDARLKEKRANELNLMRVINENQKLQADLNRRHHELVTGGLWLDASKACAGRGSLPGKTQSASIADRTAGPDKIRLPAENEGRLLSIAYDAQELVGRYNDLRNICLPLVFVAD